MELKQERAVTTSISLEPSKMEKLKKIAFEEGYKSRNDLIFCILTDWLKEYGKKQVKRRF